jgi:ADP-heptose:LPS heptosyltransferase
VSDRVSILRRAARRGIYQLRRYRTQRAAQKAIASFHRETGRKILCISLIEHMGDIIACEPVARRARELHPDAKIIWCARSAFAELIETNPNVDQFLCVESTFEWSLWADSGVFDVIWDLNVQGRPDFYHGYSLRKSHGDRSVTIQNWKAFGPLLPAFARAAGLDPWLEMPRVYLSDEVRNAVDALPLPSDFVAIHCQSGKDKNWTPEKWRQLIDRIQRQHDMTVIEVGATPMFPDTGALCGRLSILQSAELIRRAALFIGIDSGPAHLASAVGTPGVILLGQWSPYACADWARFVRAADRVNDIEVDDVASAVSEQLSAVTR